METISLKKDEKGYIPISKNIINNKKEYDEKEHYEKEYYEKEHDEKEHDEKKYDNIKNNNTDIKNNDNSILQKSIELNSFNPGTSPNNNSFMDKLNIRILMY